MLIVTRKIGERVVVTTTAGVITVEVLSFRNTKSAVLRAEGPGAINQDEASVYVNGVWKLPEKLVGTPEIIKVFVLEVARGQVKIGVEAPRDMPVDREEVYLSKLEDPR